MNAADAYRARVEAVAAQQARLAASAEGPSWDRMAASFRLDPRREMDRNLAALAEFVEPDDVVVDVGGGAGRVCLPLALSCREVVNVDPSPGMCEQFAASAQEAGITNARAVCAGWEEAEGVSGDVVLAFNVTYFVADIVPFVEKLAAAARRRVVIGAWSVPPPNRDAAIFEVMTGEPQELYPGHTELLPVLWEMGILPDIRVLPEPFTGRAGGGPTREETIEATIAQVRPLDREAARERLEAAFDTLFVETPRGFRPAQRRDSREMLITWEVSPL
ncbi:MAG: methyltransferase domain-containing protein [Chloroflexi bacterium]|nr:methyltransferase domain-containing protein [Chloroflexota bacterium]